MRRIIIVEHVLEMDDTLVDDGFGFEINGAREWWPGANTWLLPPGTAKILDEHIATLKKQADPEFTLPSGKMKLATVYRRGEVLAPWWVGRHGDNPTLAAAREFFAENYAFDDDQAVERSQGNLVRLDVDEARGADGCVVQLRFFDGDKYGVSACVGMHVHAFDTPHENDGDFRKRCFAFRAEVNATVTLVNVEKRKLRKWGRII